MRWTYLVLAVAGLTLAVWAGVVNPRGGASKCDDPQTWPTVTRGPYRFLRHPMYVGTWVMVVGFAGLAAGFWNCLAVGTIAELLLRDWSRREGV